MSNNKLIIGTGTLLGVTLLSFSLLTIPKAKADSIVDVVVNVPTACTLTPTSTSLTKTINPGSPDTIGTAAIKAVCNDPSGFAIYAVGYTNDEYGSNQLITELGSTYNIDTGVEEHPTESQWNMTITNASTTGNYTADIENDFDEAHEIPEVYTKVATVASITDQTIGTNLNAKFDAYIASDQPASTYTGKVKFMLVHPATAPTPNDITHSTKDVTVTFNLGSNDYFYLDDNDNPVRTNIVTYHGECDCEHVRSEVFSTPNIAGDGARLRDLSISDFEWSERDGGYYYPDITSAYTVEERDKILFRSFPGASKLKIIIDYDFEINENNQFIENINTGEIHYENAAIVVGNYGFSEFYELYGTGSRELVVDGDKVGIMIGLFNDTVTINSAHNKGFYATIYPLDEDENEIEIVRMSCTWAISEGAYMNGHRYIEDVWTLDGSHSYPIEELLNNLGAGTELNVLPPQK